MHFSLHLFVSVWIEFKFGLPVHHHGWMSFFIDFGVAPIHVLFNEFVLILSHFLGSRVVAIIYIKLGEPLQFLKNTYNHSVMNSL